MRRPPRDPRRVPAKSSRRGGTRWPQAPVSTWPGSSRSSWPRRARTCCGRCWKTFVEALMGAEADALCGAGYGERRPERVNCRNGYRSRDWDTRAGTIEVAIPKLRSGSYFPDWLLERRRRAEQALINVVASEDGAGWLAFLRALVARGLAGVALVTSDAHPGLVEAIGATLPGASWQRCRAHYARNLSTQVAKSAQPWVLTLLRTVFAQSDPVEVSAQFDRVVEALEAKFPRAAAHLAEARDDLLAFTAFPREV